MNVLLVADGSGGHLIPAMQVAGRLAEQGATIKLWYADRRQVRGLAEALRQDMPPSIDVDPIAMSSSRSPLMRLQQCQALWRRASQCFNTFRPDVVVGFGGWISAPVVLAAKSRRISCVVHEQNVLPGLANRWLSRVADEVAVSFPETERHLTRRRAVVTGLPIRSTIGASSREDAARRLGLDPARPTLLIVGGSQGSQAINRLALAMIPRVSAEESAAWQAIHITGLSEEAAARAAYAARALRAVVCAFLTDMDAAYAASDLVIARAGASTLAEVARCGKPAILMPYPYAGGHQRANARAAEATGGAVVLDEATTNAERLLAAVRRLLADRGMRARMGAAITQLQPRGADARLADSIVQLGASRAGAAHVR